MNLFSLLVGCIPIAVVSKLCWKDPEGLSAPASLPGIDDK